MQTLFMCLRPYFTILPLHGHFAHGMGNWHHRKGDTQSIKWTRIHLSGNWLLYKWVEAASYRTLTSAKVAKFIKENRICRYGVPHELISDLGSHLKKEVEQLCIRYQIQQHKSSPYRPQTNGAAEAANKNIGQIPRKMTDTYRDWPEKFSLALWGYRTSIRTSTGATPYSLVYGMEAVLSVELEVPSLRVALES